MSRTGKWLVAGFVTAATFVACASISGMLLGPVMASSADRWVLAAGLGAAMAGLAALWGKWWATREDAPSSVGTASAYSLGTNKPADRRFGERSITADGDIGIASSGDEAINVQSR
jgi:hypothetical protein